MFENKNLWIINQTGSELQLSLSFLRKFYNIKKFINIYHQGVANKLVFLSLMYSRLPHWFCSDPIEKLLLMKIILLISCAALSTGLLAQRSTSKKVDTRFINVPNYDVGSTDISSLKSSFAIGNSVYGTQKLKDTKTTCVAKGGSLKDAKEVTTYYYELDVTRPSSFLFLKDEKGNTVYANQLATESTDKAEYGKGKCEFWMKPSLEKSYKSDEASWKESNHGTYTKNLKQKAEMSQVEMLLYPQILLR